LPFGIDTTRQSKADWVSTLGLRRVLWLKGNRSGAVAALAPISFFLNCLHAYLSCNCTPTDDGIGVATEAG
jgi:hypothetical protein